MVRYLTCQVLLVIVFVECISPLPSWCYDPPGDSCEWYPQCLETSHPCRNSGGKYNYAMGFAYRFCKRYDTTYPKFSTKGRRWIDAVRKCLQVSMIDQLNSTTATCKTIEDKAFHTHECCYLAHPACTPAGTPSVCQLKVMDWIYIFKTVGRAFLSQDALRQMFKTAMKCAKIKITDIIG